MLNFVFLMACFSGLAVWIPGFDKERSAWFGVRFFFAILALPLILYIGNVALSVPLGLVSWAVVGLAGAGLVHRLFVHRLSGPELAWRISHPVLVFAAMLVMVIALRGGIDYLPYPGDEVFSWLRHARQIFLADAFWSEKMVYHLGGYTNGWPLMIAFPNLLNGEYADRHGAVLPFLMHIGLLGALFDVTRWVAIRQGMAQRGMAALAAWTLLLALLAVQASWILFPTFQLIDKPLLYVILGGLLIGLAGQFDGLGRLRLSLFLGVAMASGYLLKVSMMVFGPVLGVFWLSFLFRELSPGGAVREFIGRLDRRAVGLGAVMAAAMLLPFAIAVISWTFLRTGTHCNASPIDLLTQLDGPAAGHPLAVAKEMWGAVIDYVVTFKPGLSLFAGASMVAMLAWPRLRWFVAAICVLVLVQSFALYVSYMTCLDSTASPELQSLPRFFRQNLRFIHFFGPVLLAFWLLHQTRFREAAEGLLARGAGRLAGGILLALLAGLQVWSLDRSLEDIALRADQDPAITERIIAMSRESAALRTHLKRRNQNMARVSLIAQRGYNVEYGLASYFGIRTKPGGNYFHYTLARPYSWAETRLNPATKVTTTDQLAAWWRGFDVVWPVRTDAWTRRVIATITRDPACASAPEKFFLFNNGNGRFDCRAKNSAGQQ